MPIWNTESGYFVENPEQPVKPHYPGTDYVFARVLTPDELAAYMVRAHVLNAAVGVARFYWYSWDIRNMGLTRTFGQTPTIASIAYGTMRRWLVGANLRHCATEDDKVWVCELERDGQRANLVWHVSEDSRFNIPKEFKASVVERIDGSNVPVEGPSVGIGIAPILLRGGRVWKSSSESELRRGVAWSLCC